MKTPMSSLQWAIGYLCAAALVTGGSVMFAAWSRTSQQSAPAVTVPALLAGALWPLVVAGLFQWLLVYGLATVLRQESARREDVQHYGATPSDQMSRPTVGAT